MTFFARLFVACVASLCVLVGPDVARALECGSDIVAVGDSNARVRSSCGEPLSVISRTEARTVYETYGQTNVRGVAVTVTVQVDVWVYDFGPGRFSQELTFENGVLVRTRTLSRSR